MPLCFQCKRDVVCPPLAKSDRTFVMKCLCDACWAKAKRHPHQRCIRCLRETRVMYLIPGWSYMCSECSGGV